PNHHAGLIVRALLGREVVAAALCAVGHFVKQIELVETAGRVARATVWIRLLKMIELGPAGGRRNREWNVARGRCTRQAQRRREASIEIPHTCQQHRPRWYGSTGGATRTSQRAWRHQHVVCCGLIDLLALIRNAHAIDRLPVARQSYTKKQRCKTDRAA